MAIDNRLQIFDENGNPVDYDIMATDVKFADGKDLPTKLDELEDEIGESQGGYTPPPGGIPKTDLAPAVQQTLDDVAGKVDKVTGYGLSKNDYTDTDKAKVDNLKPVATSGSYNDLTDKPTIPTVPTMDAAPTIGNTSHSVSSDGVASAIANAVAEAGGGRTISILFVGNSLTQDAVSYLPLVLKELAPNLSFKFYMWYDGGAVLSEILGKWNNNTAATIFSTCENVTSWTNSSNTKMSEFLSSGKTFDIVCLEEYFNYKRDNGYTDKTVFEDVITYIRSHYNKAFKVVSLFHRPLCKNPSTEQPDLSIADEVFGLTYDGIRWQLENTISEDVIPTGIASYRAMYDNTLNGLGDFGYMSPDGTHSQEGLPCLMQAWVTAMWVLNRLAIPASINNAQVRVTTANYSSINVPGANLGTGIVVGTDAQDKAAMDVAIKAYKEGQRMVERFVSPNGIPAYGISIDGASGTKTDRAVQLSASPLPADADVAGITWSIVSGDATVTDNGLVTYNGTSRTASVVVRATLEGGSLKAEATLSFSLAAVETPVFSPAAGTYAGAQSVTISCATAGATIYYTTDGSTPTAQSSVYSSAIAVASDMTIKAIAIKDNESSNVATAAYVIAVARTVTVSVADGSTAIEGATVKLSAGGAEHLPTSSSGGSYVFSVADGTYTLSVAKHGYVTHTEQCVVSGDKTVSVSMGVRDLLADALVTNPNCMADYGNHGTLYPSMVRVAAPSQGAANAGAYISQINGRCGIAINRDAATEPIAWHTNTGAGIDQNIQQYAHQLYSMVEWPLDKDTLTIRMSNTNYYVALAVANKEQSAFNTQPYDWLQGGANCEIVLDRTTYPSMFYVAIVFKYLAAGTTWVSASISDLGITVTAE